MCIRDRVRILKESYQDLLEGKPENYSPFRPGMTATVEIITNRKDNVIAVPISAIVVKSDTSATDKKKKVDEKVATTDKKFETVFVKKGEEAKLRVVKTGIQDDAKIEVTSGLEVGEEVITGPYNTVTKTLKAGDKVEIAGEKESD